MGKFYIRGNNQTFIINRPTPRLAALAFLEYYSGRGLMPPQFLHVNETGNFNQISTDEVFEVDELLGEKI